MQIRLRTLLIVLAVGPPLLWAGWTKYAAWKAEQERIPIIVDEVEVAWHQDLREFSEPPATPMQPGELDVRKLTRPGK